jgi:hypothetical protein
MLLQLVERQLKESSNTSNLRKNPLIDLATPHASPPCYAEGGDFRAMLTELLPIDFASD